jgi:hypothetical protein
MHHTVHSIQYRILENILLFTLTGVGFGLVEIGLFLRKRYEDKKR